MAKTDDEKIVTFEKKLGGFVGIHVEMLLTSEENMMQCRNDIRTWWNNLDESEKILNGPLVRTKMEGLKLLAEAIAQEFKTISITGVR